MPIAFKQSLENLIRQKAPGPSASFSVCHLILALAIIAEKPVGRNKLAEELDLGEGVARTLIGRLRDAGLIKTSKAGCFLTDKGLRLWKEYESTFKMTEIGRSELTFGDHSFAILVRNRGHKVKLGLEQRDAAVMAGAKGATTMLFKKGRLIFPSTNKGVARDFPEASKQISNLLGLRENDAIIVASSDSPCKAEYGALAAAWTLLNDHREK